MSVNRRANRAIFAAAVASAAMLCGARAWAAAPRPAAVSAVAGEVARVDRNGLQYVVPRGWTEEVRAGVVRLASPDRDVQVALVGVGQARDAADAMARAWRRVHPAGAAKVEGLGPLPAEDGWDESVSGRVSGSGPAPSHARALRQGARWFVVLADGAGPAFEKHSGTLSQAQQSVLAPGFRPESFAGRKVHHLDAQRIAALEAFIARSMETLGVPGAAYALIDHGVVVAQGGMGVRELGKPDPVTADTLFMVGSNTKGMTTLLLSKAVDEGRLSWDEPVVKAYPAFRLGDPDITKKVLIRHLICACTGMPRQDLEWMFGTDGQASGARTFDLLSTSKPTTRFGEEYQYSNLMASAAGFVAAHAFYPELNLDAAYDKAMHEKIFAPLGMTSTFFEYDKALGLNHAAAHGVDLTGRPAVSRIPFNYPAVAPAGLVWSTARDMTRYVMNELSEGRAADGTRLFSAENLLERRKPFVVRNRDQYYGMGLMTDRIGGIEVVRHGGATFGHLTNWYAIPDAQVGAVLLTNSSLGYLMLDPFGRKLMEVLYDGAPLAEAQVKAAAEAARLEHAAAVKDVRYPPSADVTGGLAASYASPELGHIAVRRDDDGLYFDFGPFGSRMGVIQSAKGVTLVPIDPTAPPIAFSSETRDGQGVLVVHAGDRDYVYRPTPPPR